MTHAHPMRAARSLRQAAEAAAVAEYDASGAPAAFAEYRRACEAAYAHFQATQPPTLADYHRATAAAWVAFEDRRGALQTYQRRDSIAHSDYRAAKRAVIADRERMQPALLL